MVRGLADPSLMGKKYVAVQASCSDSDGTDVNVPTIKINMLVD